MCRIVRDDCSLQSAEVRYSTDVPRIHLLGVPIDALSRKEAVQALHACCGGGRHHVMTPNSEMLVEATRNPRFHALLRSTQLNLPDSQGLLWMARVTGQRLPERVSGVDAVQELCAKLDEQHPVFLLGAAPGVSDRAAEELQRRNPRLRIAGTYVGSPRPQDSAEILRRIQAVGPHILFVAFGAPAQDLWIAKHLPLLPSVRLAMGVGGTFDFLAGVQKRAPRWMQKLGLEWLWRVLREPRRIGRIWRAVIVFPWLVLTRQNR